jgi:rhamnosyltransferase
METNSKRRIDSENAWTGAKVTVDDVCAVVVTFHPRKDVFDNLAKACRQFTKVIVVDNGSDEPMFGDLQLASEKLGFELIENGDNLGIAAALNIGIRRAGDRHCQAVVLFDQDSTVTDGFLEAMLAAYQSNLQWEKVAIVAPRHWDRNSKSWLTPQRSPDGNLRLTITSGSMTPLPVFSKCGWFDEDYIIDMVDTEYCLRVRWHGFTIQLAESASLLHSVGTLKEHSLLGLKKYRVSHHSASRRYYMTRNRLVTLFRYWRFERSLVYQVVKSIVLDAFIIALFEKQFLRKIVNTCIGVVDALRGRMGKVIDL